MIEAFLGILIASLASVSLVISIGVSNNAFKNAGKNSLSTQEKQVIKNAGFTENDINSVEIDIMNFVLK